MARLTVALLGWLLLAPAKTTAQETGAPPPQTDVDPEARQAAPSTLGPAAAPPAASPPANGDTKLPPAVCENPEQVADFLAKRRHRAERDRIYPEAHRHEFSFIGGYLISDLFDGSYLIGGSYAYHMTDEIGVEAAATYAHFSSAGLIERERNFSLLGGREQSALFLDADLTWAPLQGKMRLFGGPIAHLVWTLFGGAGIVDSSVSTGVAGNFGMGFKIFMSEALAVRIDIRDHIYKQQLLNRSMLVQDLSVTLGLSVYLPWGI